MRRSLSADHAPPPWAATHTSSSSSCRPAARPRAHCSSARRTRRGEPVRGGVCGVGCYRLRTRDLSRTSRRGEEDDGFFLSPQSVCARSHTHSLCVCLSLSLFVATKRAPAVCPRRLCPSLRPLATAFSFRQVHQGPAKHAAVPGRYRQHCPSVSSSSSSTTTTTTHIRYHYCTGLSVSWPMQLARDCRTEEDEPGS